MKRLINTFQKYLYKQNLFKFRKLLGFYFQITYHDLLAVADVRADWRHSAVAQLFAQICTTDLMKTKTHITEYFILT